MTKGAIELKKRRVKKGLTQEQLSASTGVTRSVIALIEADETYKTSVDTAKVLADSLGFKWNLFFEEV